MNTKTTTRRSSRSGGYTHSRSISSQRRNKRSTPYNGGGSSYGRNNRNASRGRGRGRNDSRGGRGKGRGRGQYIDPQKFINLNPTTKTEAIYVPKNLFKDFGLSLRIVSNLENIGITSPSKIQDESIPHVLQGKDVVGLANTGSGKTAAFLVPVIHKIGLLKKAGLHETALILAPTRELAMQIQDEFKRFTEHINIHSALCVGGMSSYHQIKQLRRGPQVVIGTPGRVKDLIEQGELKLDATTTFILDEADRMLDMGFLPAIKDIISEIKEKPQTLCFSATITPEITKLLDRMLKDPVTVSVRTSETGEHIAQDIIYVPEEAKRFDTLCEVLEEIDYDKILIFAEMKYTVSDLVKKLARAGISAEAIHGNKTQPQRQRSLKNFKEGKVDILVATDVAARGLDIPNVTHVINYEQPQTYEDYIHRIGRTGRAGKEGQAYTFVVKK